MEVIAMLQMAAAVINLAVAVAGLARAVIAAVMATRRHSKNEKG